MIRRAEQIFSVTSTFCNKEGLTTRLWIKAVKELKQWQLQHSRVGYLPACNPVAEIWLHKWKAIVKEHSDVSLMVWGLAAQCPWSAFAVHCVGNVPCKQLWTKWDFHNQVCQWRVFPSLFPVKMKTLPLSTTQQWLATIWEKSLQCLCGEKKIEHKVFSHRVRAECKPPKCFILCHTCLPWLVGNPVNVGMTSSVHGCSAVTAGHCNDLSLNVFLRHVPHVTANYAGVKEASKHSSLNVMALVQFYFIKLLQYKTEVKQFFWGLELLCS